MKVIEHLNKADKTLFTVEVLPPKKGDNINSLFDHIDPLMEFKPPFVDVTWVAAAPHYSQTTRDGGNLCRY